MSSILSEKQKIYRLYDMCLTHTLLLLFLCFKILGEKWWCFFSLPYPKTIITFLRLFQPLPYDDRLGPIHLFIDLTKP